VVPGIYFVSVPGHTPGHTAFHLSSGNAQLMISNDAAYVPALCVNHPGWHGAFDQNGDMAETSRRKLLDRVGRRSDDDLRSHFPWPGLAKITKDGGSYAVTTIAECVTHARPGLNGARSSRGDACQPNP